MYILSSKFKRKNINPLKKKIARVRTLGVVKRIDNTALTGLVRRNRVPRWKFRGGWLALLLGNGA